MSFYILFVGFSSNEVQKSQSVGHLVPATAGLYFPDFHYKEASLTCVENVLRLTCSTKQVVNGYFDHKRTG